jgi:outer membrane protein assembly factor BamB
VTKQEVIACYDAGTGAKRWEHRQNVYHSTVAFNRIGWASLAGDPATGNVYAHGSGGQLNAFAPDGSKLWEINLAEEFGRATGYGGRSQTPLVVGDRVLLNFVTDGWGDHAAPRTRVFAFDKKTGEVVWVTTPGRMPHDMNFQANLVHAVIDGRQLVIAGDADGHVYALDLLTGRPVWSFALSRQGLQNTVVVAGDTVFASHSEENLDAATMGRLVAFRATGNGDLTKQQLWQVDELTAGFPSPAYSDGKLYVVDNSANLYRVDAATGAVEWTHELGTVGKASPVVADGKIYVPELNGRFHVLRPGPEGPETLSEAHIAVADGRYAEIYGSPAVAYGRIYLATEGGLHCFGDPSKPFRVEGSPPPSALPRGAGAPAALLVTPGEVRLAPGTAGVFRASAYDAKGLPVELPPPGTWTLEGLAGEISADGRFQPSGAGAQAGRVSATAGGLTASARVRVIPDLPWSLDFEDQAPGSVPGWWVGAKDKYAVAELDGGRVLSKPDRDRGLLRNPVFFGGDFSNYTIEADVRGGQAGRRMTDVGLLNSGYTLDLLGNLQRLEIRDWTAERRIAKAVDLPWSMDTWYRMKLEVRTVSGRGLIRGRVWQRGQPEPADWSITVEDPLPIKSGSPGLIGYSPADIYYDNIRITENE